MKQIPSASDTLVVFGEFENFTPEELFDYWVTPELVTQWWSKSAAVDGRVGGTYKFSWPEQDWTLQGTYEAFDRGKQLRFTWAWNHEQGSEPLTVDVFFMPIENGTRLAINHGPYSDTETGQTEKQGHLEGWIHFGMRLAGLRVGTDE